MEASEIRRVMLERRDGLEVLQRRDLSAKMIQHLSNLPQWRSAKTVMLYATFRGEAPTQAVDQLAREAGKTVAYPRADTRMKAMQICQVEHLQALKPGAYGIPEPAASCPLLEPKMLDLVLVPGVVFDRHGQRMGYGAGYYDRFLPLCEQAFRLGWGFGLQVIDHLPKQPHDQALNALVTEHGIMRWV
jgi:5-formyltetrahydrofolate cyclo-ligase